MTGEDEDARRRMRAPQERSQWVSGGGPTRRILGDIPVSVAVLAGGLALVFFGLWIAPAAFEDYVGARFGLSPERLVAGANAPGGLVWAIVPLFSHMLIHASPTHLLFNLLWLLVFGTPIAHRFRSVWRFYAFFAASGAAGGLFFSMFHLDDATLLIGASGGITGLLGGLVRFAFHRPLSKPASAKGVLPLTDRSVLIWSAVVIAMNASISLFGAGVGGDGASIAWQAHVGGYLFGLVAFPLFDPRAR